MHYACVAGHALSSRDTVPLLLVRAVLSCIYLLVPEVHVQVFVHKELRSLQQPHLIWARTRIEFGVPFLDTFPRFLAR